MKNWRLGALVVSLLAMLLGPAAVVSAQEATLEHSDDAGLGIVTVQVLVSGGSSSGVGLAFARFDLENFDTRPHAVTVELQSPRYLDVDVVTRRSLVLSPGRTRFFLPLAVPPVRGRLEVYVDGHRSATSVNYRRGTGAVGLFISDRSGTKSYGVQALEAMPMQRGGSSLAKARGGASPELVTMQSGDLPLDWRMFTSFSTIIVDGRSVLSSDLQEAVRRYAFAGGTVVVSAAGSLPAGALREHASARPSSIVAHGLGFIVPIPAFGGDTSVMRERLSELPELGSGLWPAPANMFGVQDIAGLGEAPVAVFVMVILAFAILVGPVNFMILRRRKKPLLALLTVPVLGFGTTFAILAYGIFHDGFGARGVVRSWTLLDQARHEAVSLSARTLFAGLAPNDLTMNADTMLLSARAGVRNDRWPDRWHWDADTERLDGGILPSRTVTPLLSVQQGPVRERLTVRRSGDTLTVLSDGGIVPVGDMLLRDLDGQYWLGREEVLQRIPAAEGRRQFAALRVSAASIPTLGPDGEQTISLPRLLPEWGSAGTYVTRVASTPWIDEHGIEVDYDLQVHFVFGRMHAQDFVR